MKAFRFLLFLFLFVVVIYGDNSPDAAPANTEAVTNSDKLPQPLDKNWRLITLDKMKDNVDLLVEQDDMRVGLKEDISH